MENLYNLLNLQTYGIPVAFESSYFSKSKTMETLSNDDIARLANIYPDIQSFQIKKWMMDNKDRIIKSLGNPSCVVVSKWTESCIKEIIPNNVWIEQGNPYRATLMKGRGILAFEFQKILDQCGGGISVAKNHANLLNKQFACTDVFEIIHAMDNCVETIADCAGPLSIDARSKYQDWVQFRFIPYVIDTSLQMNEILAKLSSYPELINARNDEIRLFKKIYTPAVCNKDKISLSELETLLNSILQIPIENTLSNSRILGFFTTGNTLKKSSYPYYYGVSKDFCGEERFFGGSGSLSKNLQYISDGLNTDIPENVKCDIITNNYPNCKLSTVLGVVYKTENSVEPKCKEYCIFTVESLSGTPVKSGTYLLYRTEDGRTLGKLFTNSDNTMIIESSDTIELTNTEGKNQYEISIKYFNS